MGSDRKEHSDEPKTKIRLIDHFGIDVKKIHDIWKDYNHLRSIGYDEKETVSRLQILYSPFDDELENIYDYFLVLGLELINAEMSKKNEG